jgi:hypothetical protein
MDFFKGEVILINLNVEDHSPGPLNMGTWLSGLKKYLTFVLTPQIAGHNLKNKLGLIKFGNYDNNKKKIYT